MFNSKHVISNNQLYHMRFSYNILYNTILLDFIY